MGISLSVLNPIMYVLLFVYGVVLILALFLKELRKKRFFLVCSIVVGSLCLLVNILRLIAAIEFDAVNLGGYILTIPVWIFAIFALIRMYKE